MQNYMSKFKIIKIFAFLIIIFSFSFLIFNLFRPSLTSLISPKISYIFNPAPSSSGHAYVNENKLTGLKIYLGKKDSPRIPSLRLEAKEGSLDLSMSNVGESGFKKT